MSKPKRNPKDDLYNALMVILSIFGIIVSLVDFTSKSKSIILSILLVLGCIALFLLFMSQNSRIRYFSLVMAVVLLGSSLLSIYTNNKNLTKEVSALENDLLSANSEQEDEEQGIYEMGNEFLARKDYANAIAQYATIPETSPLYISAQEKLDEAKAGYASDIEENASRLVGEGNYTGALELIKRALTIMPNDTTLLVLREITAQGYIDNIEIAASEAYDDNGYEAALQVLNGAKSILENNPRLMELSTHYESLRPVALNTLEVWQTANGTWTSGVGPYNGNVESNMGEIYTTYYTGFGWTSYRLNNGFKRLTAIAFIKKSSNSTEEDGWVEFRDDDGEIIGRQYHLTGGVEPILIDIDVTGVDVLHVVVNNYKFLDYFPDHIYLAEVYLHRV